MTSCSWDCRYVRVNRESRCYCTNPEVADTDATPDTEQYHLFRHPDKARFFPQPVDRIKWVEWGERCALDVQETLF